MNRAKETRGRPATRRNKIGVGLYLTPELIAQIDDYSEKFGEEHVIKLPRTAVVEMLIRRGLKAAGYEKI